MSRPDFQRLAVGVASLAFAGAWGCSAARGPSRVLPPRGDRAAECADIGAVLDLRAELLDDLKDDDDPTRIASLDAAIASLEVAQPRLGPAFAGLRTEAQTVSAELGATRAELDERAKKLQQSYAAVDQALDALALCQNVDLRTLQPESSGAWTRRARALHTTSPPSTAAERAKLERVAESKACAPASRVLAALTGLDVGSRASTAALGQHVAEMTVVGPAAITRDELVRSLRAHAENHAELAAALATKKLYQGSGAKLPRLVAALEERANACNSVAGDPTGRVVSSHAPPRRVTVLVRPKWEAQGAAAATDTGVFGSGIVVRWQASSGAIETRIVSNAHVLGEAEQAEIFDADSLARSVEERRPEGEAKGWRARVVRISPDDDLAVLRLETESAGLGEGVSLRTVAPREDEPVIAAGFPGIGARPSFQLSRGTVSNAELRLDRGLFGTYVQHTAPIDPGNSGGPLFDAEGRLLGINTTKIKGREGVGMAIPTARVQAALLRADDRRRFLVGHAAALCRVFVGALSARAPTGAVVEHASTVLRDSAERTLDAHAVAYRDAVQGDGRDGPIWEIRRVAFARLRARLDAEGGVPMLASCTDVQMTTPPTAASLATFRATFASRGRPHTLRMEDEHGVLRVVGVD